MKTIKEGLNEAYERAGQNSYFGNGFIAGVKFAQRWISVEDELPEKRGYYLIITRPIFQDNCSVVVAEFNESDKTFYYERSYSPIENATHWRPIELK